MQTGKFSANNFVLSIAKGKCLKLQGDRFKLIHTMRGFDGATACFLILFFFSKSGFLVLLLLGKEQSFSFIHTNYVILLMMGKFLPPPPRKNKKNPHSRIKGVFTVVILFTLLASWQKKFICKASKYFSFFILV